MEQVSEAIRLRNEQMLAQQMVLTGRVAPQHDELIKGKPAQEGEVRTWNNQKFRKQGKEWVPVSNGVKKSAPQNGKSKNSAKPDTQSNKPGQDQPSNKPNIGSAEIAQLKRVKQALQSGDMDQASKIANSLSDEAKNVIPPSEWVKIHEHGDKQQASQEQEKADKAQSKQSAKKSILEHTQNQFKGFVDKHKDLFDTGEHTHPERSKLAKFLRGKVKGLVKGIKHEIHHMKEAGSALKKIFTGKGKELTHHEKGALRKIGISLGLTVGSMVATGGLGIFSHGVGTFFSHLGIHFAEHSLLETTGLALLFAKAINDQLDDSEDDKYYEMLVHQFADFVENGDWSKLPQQAEDDEDDEEGSKLKKNDKPLSKSIEVAGSIINDLLQKAHKYGKNPQGFVLQGEIDFQGLTIKVENKKGSVRKGTSEDGKEWVTKMKYPYGYISRTKAADDEHVDCYVGDNRKSELVFVVHQVDPKTGKYDEDKVMLGFDSEKEAKQAYLDHYDDPKFFGSMTKVTFDELRQMLKDKKGEKLQKALHTIDLTNILEKGGKAAVIGEIRKFGGRDYIKTAQGWKFHGKGQGQKAQQHAKEAGLKQRTVEHIAENTFKRIYTANQCTDQSDCDQALKELQQLIDYAQSNNIDTKKYYVRFAQVANKKDQFIVNPDKAYIQAKTVFEKKFTDDYHHFSDEGTEYNLDTHEKEQKFEIHSDKGSFNAFVNSKGKVRIVSLKSNDIPEIPDVVGTITGTTAKQRGEEKSKIEIPKNRLKTLINHIYDGHSAQSFSNNPASIKGDVQGIVNGINKARRAIEKFTIEFGVQAIQNSLSKIDLDQLIEFTKKNPVYDKDNKQVDFNSVKKR